MTNDDKIIKLKETIEQKRVELGKEPRFVPVTSCLLKVDFSINTNIHTLNDINSINNALLVLGLYELAAEKQGISTKEVELNDFTLEDWLNDLKSKKNQLEYRKKKKELDGLETKLTGLMSETKKTELAINDIEKFLAE